MHPTLFELGPLRVTLLGLFSAIGAIAGLLVVQREARRKRWDETLLTNGLIVVLISAIAAARIYYALVFNPALFLANPLRIFAFHEGGMSIQGGLLGGILGGAIYFRLKRTSFWRAADTIAPGIILAQAIGRVGCDVFGVEMTRSLPWAVAIDGRFLHPAQMYESMLNYLLFLGVWSVRDRTRKSGELFLIYLAGFATNRFVVEFFRTNPVARGPLTVAHATSIVMVVIAALLFVVLRARGAEIDHASEMPAVGKMKAAAGVASLMVVSLIVYYLIYRG